MPGAPLGRPSGGGLGIETVGNPGKPGKLGKKGRPVGIVIGGPVIPDLGG